MPRLSWRDAIERSDALARARRALAHSPVVALPHESGRSGTVDLFDWAESRERGELLESSMGPEI